MKVEMKMKMKIKRGRWRQGGEANMETDWGIIRWKQERGLRTGRCLGEGPRQWR